MIDKVLYLFARTLKKIQNIPAIKNCKIHKTAKVCAGAQIVDSSMGRYSYVGESCCIIKCEIGSFCSIAGQSTIGGSGHPIDWVSTSPVFHQGRNVMGKNFSNHPFEVTKHTLIGNDVWIGSKCLIKSGVTIGDGAVIGMGSVVTKDVEPYSIVGGNPAKIIRKRFDEETIIGLLKSKWWLKGDVELKTLARDMEFPREFLEKNYHCSDGNQAEYI